MKNHDRIYYVKKLHNVCDTQTHYEQGLPSLAFKVGLNSAEFGFQNLI